MGSQKQVQSNTKTNVSGTNPPVHSIDHTTVIKSKPGPNTNQTTTKHTVALQKMQAEKSGNVSNTHAQSATTKTSNTQTHTKGEPTRTVQTLYEKNTSNLASATKK